MTPLLLFFLVSVLPNLLLLGFLYLLVQWLKGTSK